MTPVRVALVGVYGHGRKHLANIQRLRQEGLVELVGVCDTRPISQAAALELGATHVSRSLHILIPQARPELVVIATPIQTHADLAIAALHAGSHVFLEKPPASTLADFERILSATRGDGVDCQVGFQHLGSQALGSINQILVEGRIGQVQRIGVAGTWVRDSSYYSRAPWAGRRTLDGTPVVDGALTNPFAHGLATALHVAGAEMAGDLGQIETELYRAHPIEADDTACLRLTTTSNTTITAAVTLCAEAVAEPSVTVHGTHGTITLWYRRDELRLEFGNAAETTALGRADLLENLVHHVRNPQVALLAPLHRFHGFMQTVEAIRLAPSPIEIGSKYQQIDHPTGRRIVLGVDDAVARAAESGFMFSELDVPWASGTPAASLVGEYQ